MGLSEFKAKVHKHSTYDKHINFSYPLIGFSREQHQLSAKRNFKAYQKSGEAEWKYFIGD